MVDLSIIIPSIRIEGWKALVEQIGVAAGKYTFEVIFVGPKYNPDVDEFLNVKYVRDFGSPNRCQQIGLLLAEGKYVTWLVDDFETGPNHIDRFLDDLVDTSDDTVIIGNYNEDGVVAVKDFSIKHCYGGGWKINSEWKIFNVAFMHRSYLEKFGGFDCRYQVTCFGHTDLAARLQKVGCKVINKGLNIGGVKHIPGTSGDHGPVHHAQVSDDQPRFNRLTDEIFSARVKLDNWKEADSIWRYRPQP
jgi:hypothetical protein